MRKFIVIMCMFSSTTLLAKTFDFEGLFDKYETERNLPKNLLKAICMVESDLREKIVVFNDGGKGDNAYGLCQIQYRTAKSLGFKHDKRCLGRVSKFCSLLEADTNLYFASLYLQKQYIRYDGSIQKTISAYNAGSAIKGNKQYVRKVMNRLKILSIQ